VGRIYRMNKPNAPLITAIAPHAHRVGAFVHQGAFSRSSRSR